MDERRFPRLARAHEAERRYQERLAFERSHGYLSAEVAMEELSRSFRRVARVWAKATLGGWLPRVTSGYRRV